MFVRSLIPTVRIESDKAQFVRQSVRTNNAAPVAAGGTKPTSVFTIERIEAPVRTIAHVTEAVDRSLLMDFDRLTQFLSDELRLGVLLAEENQILNGNGTPPNLIGILNTVGIGAQAPGADTRPDAIHKAMTMVRSNFYVPDGIVLHPNDWEQVRLLKGTKRPLRVRAGHRGRNRKDVWGGGHCEPGHCRGNGTGRGVPAGAILFDREQARVDFTESHDDLFVKNQVIARGEERIAFGVTRPQAFATVTGI
jgi:Phage capsid family